MGLHASSIGNLFSISFGGNILTSFPWVDFVAGGPSITGGAIGVPRVLRVSGVVGVNAPLGWSSES